MYAIEEEKLNAAKEKLRNQAKAAFLGISLAEFVERSSPPVWMCVVETAQYYSKPAMNALRTDEAKIHEGDFVVQQEAEHVTTGES